MLRNFCLSDMTVCVLTVLSHELLCGDILIKVSQFEGKVHCVSVPRTTSRPHGDGNEYLSGDFICLSDTTSTP